MKIKLVAIAKDEAAYMSEWIHHHLYFGFDSIDVYTNNISDNTRDVLNKIGQNHDVTDVDADYILGCSSQGFQRIAYGIALQKAKLDGYSHIMFLDIDEFWTPKDFKTDIKQFLLNLGNPDIVSFPWAIKIDREKFSCVFENINYYAPGRFVKILLKTNTNIKKLNVHHVVSDYSRAILPDGTVFSDYGEVKAILDETYDELPEAFINHRLCRSSMEFVSLLGKGRPTDSSSISSLKDNRPGFVMPKETDLIFKICEKLLAKYSQKYLIFIEECLLAKDIEKGQEFVINRYFDVIERMRHLNFHESEKFIKLLRNVDLPEVQVVLSELELLNTKRSSSASIAPDLMNLKDELYIDDKAIEFLRDEAFKIADENPKLALSLMSLALAFRPHGPVIKSTVLELKARLKC